METLIEITDTSSGTLEDAARFVEELHFPDRGVRSAKIIGPVASSPDGHYLFCQFRDEEGAPVAAGYIKLVNLSRSPHEQSLINETVTL
ncbi:hypothetical protein [Halomonas sp. S2151]|uniref:hypothetical protein n=1 Tax=Halomonas sp. S2151 TaxID=579478 RepID=UPI0012EE5FA7|nr:hypothetical protein [Halomonas sp. S2151]